MDKVYLAIWESTMGDQRKAFKTRAAAQRQLRNWIGMFIMDTLEQDGIEEAKEIFNDIKVRTDDDNNIYYIINFGKETDELFVEQIDVEDK